jgi:hypothetical protein
VEPVVTERPSVRPGLLATGALLLLAYLQLAVQQPFQALAGRTFTFISGDEMRFWVAHWTLAAPGIILIALGIESRLAPELEKAWRRLVELQPADWRKLGMLYGLLLCLVAVAGRTLFLRDLPLTDDENLILFGARMILEGDLSVPILQPDGPFTQVFTYRLDGMVSAFDYPGAILFRALGLALGLDSLLYAVAAAVTGLAVSAAAGRALGRSGAVIAAGLWLASPMAISLSTTTHAHLVSRCFLALAIWLYCRLLTESPSPTRDGALLAASGGMAFLTRSPETAAILLPIALHLLFESRHAGRWRRATVAAAIVSLGFLAFYAWYNLRTTGIWYLPARFGPDTHMPGSNPLHTPLERLGTNLGHNLMILGVLGLGPAGLALAVFGIRHAPRLWAIPAGLGLQLGLALVHDDTGIHSVGPIHFSEMVPGLVILAAAGTLGAAKGLRRNGFGLRPPATAAAAYVLGVLTLLTLVHGLGLRAQATNWYRFFEVVELAEVENAVVIAPWPGNLLHRHPDFKDTGSWVHWLPPPDPYLRDDVLYAAEEKTDLEALRKAFPGRRFYWIRYSPEGEPIQLVRLR